MRGRRDREEGQAATTKDSVRNLKESLDRGHSFIVSVHFTKIAGEPVFGGRSKAGSIGLKSGLYGGRMGLVPGSPLPKVAGFLVSVVVCLQRSPRDAATHLSWDGNGRSERVPLVCSPARGAVGRRGRSARAGHRGEASGSLRAARGSRRRGVHPPLRQGGLGRRHVLARLRFQADQRHGPHDSVRSSEVSARRPREEVFARIHGRWAGRCDDPSPADTRLRLAGSVGR